MPIPYVYGTENRTVRVWYAYGMYHTRMVHTIRVRYKIRIWYRTVPSVAWPTRKFLVSCHALRAARTVFKFNFV